MAKGGVLSSWARRRDLASDRRAGGFAREKALRTQYRYIRRRWRVFAALLAGLCALLPLVLLLPRNARGFAAGVLLASGFWLGWIEVVLATGTSSQLMGERGELWSASELRRLRRRGWRLVNRALLRAYDGDTDHILVGPGGVLVVESKWSATPWLLVHDARVAEAVRTVRGKAHDVWLLCDSRAREQGVHCLLVLWGELDASETNACVEHDDVTVLIGTELRDWLKRLPNSGLERSEIDRFWSKLDATVRSRDDYELRRAGPPPRSPGALLTAGVKLLVAGVAGFCVSVLALGRAHELLINAVTAFTLLLVGVLARRVRAIRTVATAWLVGVSVVVLLLGVFSREVGSAGDGWFASEGGVAAVMVVEV